MSAPICGFNPKAPLGDVRFIQSLAEIEHRGKGNVLVFEPSDPFIAGSCGKGLTQEVDQSALLTGRRFGEREQFLGTESGEQVLCELDLASTQNNVAVITRFIDLIEGRATE